MRSPALAIAWEFRRRHRWGLIAMCGYLLVIATVKLLTLERGQINLDSPESFALVVIVPLTATFTYFLAVFSFGLAGDLAARQSIYPARMFTLPVTTTALAGWPMLYGAAAMTILWLATRLFAVWPSGVAVPVIWPALGAAVLLAWTQALTWMPYPLPGLRVVVTVLWLAVIDSVVLVAIQYKAPERVMLAILAPQLPLAYLAARFAVARARRGDVPDWRGMFARRAHVAFATRSGRGTFASPARAQTWLERRRHGRTLPAWTAILLPFELSLLFLAGTTPGLVFLILFGVLLTPPFMAAFVGAAVSKSNPHAADSLGMSPFIATRPLTTAALVAAKLRAALLSVVAAWLLVLAAIPIALAWSGTLPMVSEWASDVIERLGAPRAIVLALLVLAALLASTWKQLVQSLFIGLTGSEWVVRSSVFLALSFLCAIGPIVQWVIEHGRAQAALWDAFPSILAVLAGLKMSAAAWVATRLYRSRVLSDRALVTGAACWVVAVIALYALLAWLLNAPFMPRYLLGLVAILAIPLARVSAAPLALAWNRHR